MTDIVLSKFGDHGSESSRRDKFQEEFAMYLCIEMLGDPNIDYVICEYGEDVVLQRQDSFELFQVKTKQESVNAWRLDDLLPVIAKSFAIAPYMSLPVTRCHFVSNDRATGALLELKSLLDLPPGSWSEDQMRFFDDFCRKHCTRILEHIARNDPDHSYDIPQIEMRLKSLSIQTDFHHMNYLEDTNLRRLRCVVEGNGTGVASAFSVTDNALWEIYEKIAIVISTATVGRTREEKSISRQAIDTCITLQPTSAFMFRVPTEQEIEQAPGKTRLERKLLLGGFSPLFVEASRDIMVNVMSESRKWEFGLAEELIQDIRMRVRYSCADCFDRISKQIPDREQIGREILEDVRAHLPALAEYYQRRNLSFADQTFLEGIAYWLTSECLLYWSQTISQ
jgi:hypothetical protein